ncbi:hypothetical protein BVC80_1101g50 [Macleaya cordata]|uniref:Uncharacterized protein n=1 Tax=Macleaya cordata TaxID=56857 RepID=A0A200QCM6_MACCD|nr:hypothetical protein BVC80_1101g50 [Macleaya cordata]
MILSSTGFAQSIVKVATFFFPLGPAALPQVIFFASLPALSSTISMAQQGHLAIMKGSFKLEILVIGSPFSFSPLHFYRPWQSLVI